MLYLFHSFFVPLVLLLLLLLLSLPLPLPLFLYVFIRLVFPYIRFPVRSLWILHCEDTAVKLRDRVWRHRRHWLACPESQMISRRAASLTASPSAADPFYFLSPPISFPPLSLREYLERRPHNRVDLPTIFSVVQQPFRKKITILIFYLDLEKLVVFLLLFIFVLADCLIFKRPPIKAPWRNLSNLYIPA